MQLKNRLAAGSLMALLAGAVVAPGAQALEIGGTSPVASTTQSENGSALLGGTAQGKAASTSTESGVAQDTTSEAPAPTPTVPTTDQSVDTSPSQYSAANFLSPEYNAGVLHTATGTQYVSDKGVPDTRRDYPFVYQGQGQRDQWHDCGPSAVLMALADRHESPASFDEYDLSGSLSRFRAENVHANAHGGMTFEEVAKTLDENGAPTTMYTGQNALQQVEQIKQGRQAITAGQTGIFGPEDARDGYAHYVYVGGYDAQTGEFTIADSLNPDHATIQVSEQELLHFIDSNAKVNPTQVLMTF